MNDVQNRRILALLDMLYNTLAIKPHVMFVINILSISSQL